MRKRRACFWGEANGTWERPRRALQGVARGLGPLRCSVSFLFNFGQHQCIDRCGVPSLSERGGCAGERLNNCE